jgi:hypothetical protein
MKRSAGCALLASLLATTARADDLVGPASTSGAISATSASNAPKKTRAEAVGWGATSGVLAAGGAFLPIPAPYTLDLQLSASAPILASSTSDAAVNGGVQTVFIGGTVGLAFARHSDHDQWQPYFDLVASLSLHQAFYAAWLAYRDARELGASPAWNDDWRPWSSGDLWLAPFHEKNYRHHVTGAALSIEGGFFGLLAAINAVAPNGRRTSATSFARDAGLGVAAALDAGVTEEAFFRGVLYEELQLSMPKWPARVIDMTVFTAAHVPGELGANESADLIVLGLFTRALGALLFEIAYDEGGLPASTTLHAAWDTIAFTGVALLGGHPFGGNMLAPLEKNRGSATATNTGPGTVMVPLLSRAF